MRRRFFVDSFLANTAVLQGEAAEHLGRVLRAEAGQLYELSDGDCVWLAKVERVAVSKRGDNRVDFTLVEPVAVHKPRVQVDLLLAIVKFDRFEWSLEKATELGARSVTPLVAERTDKPLLMAAGKRHARWSKIALESAQQSRRVAPPVVAMPTSAESAFADASAACKIILSERRDAHPLNVALAGAKLDSANASAALAIGPEGGWTDREFAAARNAGFVEASLGENILRTETAVVASLAILRFAFGDF